MVITPQTRPPRRCRFRSCVVNMPDDETDKGAEKPGHGEAEEEADNLAPISFGWEGFHFFLIIKMNPRLRGNDAGYFIVHCP